MPAESLEEGIIHASEVSWRKFGRKIRFYTPGFVPYRNKNTQSSLASFPSISITGSYCSLNCKHCDGRILESMIPVHTPEELIEVCGQLKEKGAIGCLISGGCLPNGTVPIDRFIDAVAQVKKKFGLTIVIHTGLIRAEKAARLKDAEVDAVSIDIIGSDKTIKEIYNLEASVKDYEESLKALSESGIPFTPHILVGLHYGSIKGEYEALKMIAKYRPSALILIAFFPIKGTRMKDIKPASPEDVLKVLVQARFMMPDVPIALGCARPKGAYRKRMDVMVVEAGVNAIAFPSVEAINKAESIGLEVSFSPFCCSLIHRDCKTYIG